MAGVSGLEPEPKVLETSMLTIDTIPLRLFSILDVRFLIEDGKKILIQSQIANLKSKIKITCFLDASCGSGSGDNIF
jgi:hypothetical protein